MFEYVFACMRVYVYDLNAFCIFCYLDLFEIEKKRKKLSCFFYSKNKPQRDHKIRDQTGNSTILITNLLLSLSFFSSSAYFSAIRRCNVFLVILITNSFVFQN